MDKAELINELIVLNKQLEEVYQYHPSNPNQIDVELQYNTLKGLIEKIETQINNL